MEVGVFFLERQEMDFDIPVFLSLSLSLSGSFRALVQAREVLSAFRWHILDDH